MNIELSIIEQQVNNICERLGDKLDTDAEKRKSKGFLYLVLKNILDIDSEDEILDCIYDSGNDYAIDGLYVSDIVNDSFNIKIIQSKYTRILKQNGTHYNGESCFPRNDVIKMVKSLYLLLDPNKDLSTITPKLKTKIAEIKEYIQEGIFPTVQVFLTNNGIGWDNEAQDLIDSEEFPDWIEFIHFNHQAIINMSRTRENINDSLNVSGKVIVEDFNYARVMIAKVKVEEFFYLFQKHGNKLLEKNVRKYLGLKNNRVNEAIKESLLKESNSNFFFLNNGITMIVSDFSYNAMQERDFKVNLSDIHIINGGQTCKTIETTLKENKDFDFSNAFVLLRIYKLSQEQEHMINEITYATNSQTAINLRDLKANDDIQKSLMEDVAYLVVNENNEPEYVYKPKQDHIISRNSITSTVAAEAICSIWLQQPHIVKFRKNKLFEDNLYNKIFSNELNGAQLVLAVLIWRYVETTRKSLINTLFEKYPFIGYSSNIVAMIIGVLLLNGIGIKKNNIGHHNFNELKEKFDNLKEYYYEQSMEIVKQALESEDLRINLQDDSLQRISGAFRSVYLTNAVLKILNKEAYIINYVQQ